MNLNRELKLAIYESSLDESDKEDLLNIVESTDDEEVLSDVFDVLEASKEEADEYAKRGLQIRDMKNMIGEYNDRNSGKPINPARLENLKKSFNQVHGREEVPEEDRKRNIKAGVTGRNCNDGNYSDSVKERINKNFQNNDQKHTDKKQDIINRIVNYNKKSNNKNTKNISNARNEMMKKVIKNNITPTRLLNHELSK